jgi:hypothetical protein
MPKAGWEVYDGYRTKEDAQNAARDLRASFKSYAPNTKVAVHHDKNDSLPWQVIVKGKH